jgi:hypothetical protein
MKFEVAKLRDIIKKNRQEHYEIFVEAQKGYRAEVVKQLERILDKARSGGKIETYLNLQVPINQTQDYDRIIAMLEMTSDSHIDLTQQEFAQYVMDQWNWKMNFLAANSNYSAKAVYALSRTPEAE